jgi:hypothetical protein
LLLEHMQLVAHLRRLLELEVLGVVDHELLEALDLFAICFSLIALDLRRFLRRLQMFLLAARCRRRRSCP